MSDKDLQDAAAEAAEEIDALLNQGSGESEEEPEEQIDDQEGQEEDDQDDQDEQDDQKDDDDDSDHDDDIDPEMQRALDNGWRPKDDWNGPEGQWTDFKAFNRFYDKQQETKEAKKALDKMRSDFDALVSDFTDMRKRDREKIKADYELKLKEAKDTFDVDKVEEISKEITALEDAERKEKEEEEKKKKDNASAVPSYVTDFIAKNPALDKSSDKFNGAYHARYETELDVIARKITNNFQKQVSHEEIQKAMDDAIKKTSEAFPDIVRRRKKAPSVRQPAGNKAKSKSAASLSGAERGIYEKLKKHNPKAAEKFLNEL